MNRLPLHGSTMYRSYTRLVSRSSGMRLRAAGDHTPAVDADGAPHVSVLLNEVLEAFQPLDVKVYVDCTLGAGGHAVAVTKAHPELATLVGIDLDPTAHKLASERIHRAAAQAASGGDDNGAASRPRLAIETQFQLPCGSLYGKVDAMLMDLGLSSMQVDTADRGFSFVQNGPIDMRMGPDASMSAEDVDTADRGFSFVQNGPIDMRMDPDASMSAEDVDTADRGFSFVQNGPIDMRMDLDASMSAEDVDTADRGFSFVQNGPIDMRMDPDASMSAEDVLNTWSESELGRIIRNYGEEKLWRVVARRIVEAREKEPIVTTQQLVEAIGYTQLRGGKGGKPKGAKKGKGIHPATRTFQALRIAVNDELNKLEKALPEAINALAPGGRLAVISFHSLEDRLVKHAFMRAVGRATPDQEKFTYGAGAMDFLEQLEDQAVGKAVTRKAIKPSEEECLANPRARSAKLRVIQRKACVAISCEVANPAPRPLRPGPAGPARPYSALLALLRFCHALARPATYANEEVAATFKQLWNSATGQCKVTGPLLRYMRGSRNGIMDTQKHSSHLNQLQGTNRLEGHAPRSVLSWPGLAKTYQRPTFRTYNMQEDNLAVCCLSKCEVLKVVKGALALQCQIIKTSPKNVAMPRRIYKDHFVFCFEVDDPDEPVNPSLYFILPMVMEDFFGVPDVAERLECQRWILELSGDSSNTHVKPNLVINRDCLVAGCQVDSVNPQSRYGRAVWEDTAARSGTCFACKKDIGRESAKKCSGCKRVTYCSKECQKEDWKGHKPGCKMTLQQIQQAEVV
eukprot:gene10090-7985_t